MDYAAMEAAMRRLGLVPDDLFSSEQSSMSDRPPRLDPSVPAEQLKDRMSELKAWNARENARGPVKAPVVDRRDLISTHNNTRSSLDEFCIRSTILGTETHSSNKKLEELSRVSFSKMLLRKVHRGKYLLCRTITPPSRLVAIQAIIEDPEGQAHFVSIYNFPTTRPGSSPDYIDSLFPIGTVLAIREPTFKKPTQGQYPIIRVDTPSDIVFVQSHDTILRDIVWEKGSRVQGSPSTPSTTDGWKTLGNSHFQGKRWLPAAFAYSRGLQLDASAYLLRLNRSEAFLRLEYYSASLADAEQVLGLEDIPELSRQKALLRAAKACYGKGNYILAEEYFRKGHQLEPSNEEVERWLRSVRLRLKESQTGEYDWFRIFKESQISPHIDVANFKGPIEVKSMAGRGGGRGMVASQDIAVGDLLIVEKAFVSSFTKDLPTSERCISFNLLNETVDLGNRSSINSLCAEKIYGNPDLHDVVFHLYGGPDNKLPPPSYPPPPKVTNSVSLPLISSVDINMAHLEAICTYNIFTPTSLSIYDSEEEREDKDSPTALFPLSSLFNHACDSNALWSCMSDVIIVRALRSIRKDEEITIPYVNGDLSYLERQKYLGQHMLLDCECCICDADRKDGVQATKVRNELCSKLAALTEEGGISSGACKALVKNIEATYSPSRGPHRPEMFLVCQMLRRSTTDIREGIKVIIKSFEVVGVKVLDKSLKGPLPKLATGLPVGNDYLPSTTHPDHYIMALVSMAESFKLCGDDKRTRRWMKAAVWVNKVAHGGNKTLFLFRLGGFLRRADLLSITEQLL